MENKSKESKVKMEQLEESSSFASIYDIVAQLYPAAIKRLENTNSEIHSTGNILTFKTTEIGRYLATLPDYNISEEWMECFYDSYVRNFSTGCQLLDRDFESMAKQVAVKSNDTVEACTLPVGIIRNMIGDWKRTTTSTSTSIASQLLNQTPDHVMFSGEKQNWSDFQTTSAYIISQWSARTNSTPSSFPGILENTSLPSSFQSQTIGGLLRSTLKDTALDWCNTQGTSGFDLFGAWIREYGKLTMLHKVQFMESVLENLPQFDEMEKLVLFVQNTLNYSQQFEFTITDYILIEIIRRAHSSGREFFLDKILSMDKISATTLIEILRNLQRNTSFIRTTNEREIYDFNSSSGEFKVDSAAQVHAVPNAVGMKDVEKLNTRLNGISGSLTVQSIGNLATNSFKMTRVHVASKLQKWIFSLIAAVFNGSIKGAYLAKEHSKLILPDNSRVPLEYKGRDGWFFNTASKSFKSRRWEDTDIDKAKKSSKGNTDQH